jgi:uncharacterized repeat protein (TIGR03803 family)
VLYAFGANANDGTQPNKLIQGSDGNFYGTTAGGGAQGAGALFQVTPQGAETIVASFGGLIDDPEVPNALIQGTDQNFYGTTLVGGSYGGGALVEITAAGVETIVYSFGANSSDGRNPNALVQGGDGTFYGTTAAGGAAGFGTVFSIAGDGTETVLHSFGADAADGQTPQSLIQGSDGNLYGVTAAGGSTGAGVPFKITTAGAETVIYNPPTNSFDTLASLIQGSDGNLYATTTYGGASDNGSIVRITTAGAASTVYSFRPNLYTPFGVNSSDGQNPNGLVQGADGNLYASCPVGYFGEGLDAMIFRITTGGVETVLYRVGSPNEFPPEASLIEASDGNFYGTTDGPETIFKITPAGVESPLYSAGTNGIAYNGLTEGSDGNFYGTTFNGGNAEQGTVFTMTPTGTVTVLYTFGTQTGDGANPVGALVQTGDGNLHAATVNGGRYGLGAL